MIIAFLAWLAFLRKKPVQTMTSTRNGMFFILIGLTASLPIMISPKQLTFYIVPSIPFFALGIACLLAPHLSGAFQKIKTNTKTFKILRMVSFSFFVSALIFSVSQFGKPMRDKELLSDLRKLEVHYDPGKSIATSKAGRMNWTLLGYAKRFYNIDLNYNIPNPDYMLIVAGDTTPRDYDLIPTGMKSLDLYKAKN